jgi:putative peptide zinc metalloprotease protein
MSTAAAVQPETGPSEFRPDIEWTANPEQGKWVARDPLTARFFYFSEAEHHAAALLDGRHSLAQVLLELQAAHPHACLTREWLMLLVSRLSLSNLLLPSSGDVASRLVRTQRAAKKRSVLQVLASPLSVRIPLFNPQPWLALLRPLANLLFARPTIWLTITLGLVANLCVLARLLTSPYALNLDLTSVQGDRWLLLFLCYILVKSLHELGHGLACVRWRARCTEVGLLFLFFTPCMYCDTTDAWRLSSRWQRAAISAAGIYVELILATLAAITWLLTQDGTLHSVAANIMLICSVGTVLVNGNPFLRYDGYYILSDLWGVPNLSEQSREAIRVLLTRLLTDSRNSQGDRGWQSGSHLDRNVWALAAFGCISFVYRMFILVVILWLAWSLLVPLGLGLLAVMILAGTVLGVTLSTFRLLLRVQRSIMSHESFRLVRLLGLLAVLVAVVGFVAQVPLPVLVRARGVTDFSDKQPLFAPDAATLVDSARPHEVLRAGDVLVRLESPEKNYELASVRGEIALLSEKIDFLNRMTGFDSNAASELPLTEQLLAERQNKAQLLEKELQLLTQRAPGNGRLLPASASIAPPLAWPERAQWNLPPLESDGRGCYVPRGTLLGWFSPQEKLEVVALVSAQDIKRIALDSPVGCQWDCDVNTIIAGRVTRIAPDPVEATPVELVGDPSLVSLRTPAGQLQPAQPHYAVTIAIDDQAVTAQGVQRLKGSLVTVQIQVASEPLLETLIHAIRLSLKPVARS